MIDRRTFLKTMGATVGAFALTGLVGCAGSQTQSNEAPVSGTANESASAPANQDAPEAASDAASAVSGPAAVVYFSCTGNTKAVAEKIAEAAGADAMEIKPAEPYTAADLDYSSDCRANTEQNDASARPAIAAPIPDVSGANVVFLGYPIWWGTAPRIIETYLEDVDLAGKTVVPFCTSGSSPISGSLADLEQAAPDAIWEDGTRFSASASQQEVSEWVSGIVG